MAVENCGKRSGMNRGLGIFILLALLGGGIAGWRWLGGESSAQAAHPAPPAEVPVTTTTAKVQDVPVLLDGLGTVQALNTVEIKAQVNGVIVALPAHEGQEVHKGDIVAEIDPRPYKAALDQAIAQRGEDAAQLRSAELDLQRYQALAKRNFAPVQQVDDQQATVDKEQAAIAADEAMIETAQINLGFCVIRSPIDGRVSLYQLNVGNLVEVASQTGIISITQDRPIAVVLTLPEAQLLDVLQALARGTVPVIVNNNQDKLIAKGRLLTPNNTIDTTTGTISLKAIFPNQDDHLWPGEFVNTRVQVNVLQHAILVPELAVQHGPAGLLVNVVKPDQTIDQVSVKTGYQADGQAVVTSGLSGGEVVVLSGQSRIAAGTHVKASASPS